MSSFEHQDDRRHLPWCSLLWCLSSSEAAFSGPSLPGVVSSCSAVLLSAPQDLTECRAQRCRSLRLLFACGLCCGPSSMSPSSLPAAPASPALEERPPELELQRGGRLCAPAPHFLLEELPARRQQSCLMKSLLILQQKVFSFILGVPLSPLSQVLVLGLHGISFQKAVISERAGIVILSISQCLTCLVLLNRFWDRLLPSVKVFSVFRF